MTKTERKLTDLIDILGRRCSNLEQLARDQQQVMKQMRVALEAHNASLEQLALVRTPAQKGAAPGVN